MRKDPWVLIAGGFHRNGGMDKANLALAEHLISEDTPVHLVTHLAEDSLHQNPLVTVHPIPRPLNSFLLGRPVLDLKGRLVAGRVTSRHARATVVVNGTNCGWPGINWAHYVHHAWPPRLQDQPFFEKRTRAMVHHIEKIQERAVYRKARIVIANSNLTRRHLLEHLSLNPDRVKTLYLGSDPAWKPVTPIERVAARASFPVSESRYNSVFVGALGPDNRKGMDVLFAAWKLLCADKSWDVDLLVAGAGRTLPLWRSEIAKSGMQDRIRLLGFQANVRQLLAASDLLVSPARYEAYGLNVQEAVCCGLPAMVSASAGIAERYPADLSNFLLPDPENVSDLVARLRLWRSSVQLWKHKFEPFGLTLRSNTWQDMARNFVSLVESENFVPSTNVQALQFQ